LCAEYLRGAARFSGLRGWHLDCTEVTPRYRVCIAYPESSEADRKAIVTAYPRTEHTKEDIVQTFSEGIKHKRETTFGNVKADLLGNKDRKSNA
jgi:hypothetical protein